MVLIPSVRKTDTKSHCSLMDVSLALDGCHSALLMCFPEPGPDQYMALASAAKWISNWLFGCSGLRTELMSPGSGVQSPCGLVGFVLFHIHRLYHYPVNPTWGNRQEQILWALLEITSRPGTVAHAWNPSTLGGRGRWIPWGWDLETSLANMKKHHLY